MSTLTSVIEDLREYQDSTEDPARGRKIGPLLERLEDLLADLADVADEAETDLELALDIVGGWIDHERSRWLCLPEDERALCDARGEVLAEVRDDLLEADSTNRAVAKRLRDML